MADTLTYDPTPADPEVLTGDEQESLKIGEELLAQQDQLLAGKYKDAQELEKAYVELEKKIGEKPAESEVESDDKGEAETEPEAKEEDKPDASTLLDELWDQAQEENFNDDTLKQIESMDPRELANLHLQYRSKQAADQVTAEDVKQLQDMVGGKSEYQSMLTWAQGNLTPGEIDMFDKVIEEGSALGAFFAVRALSDRYINANGKEGKMITGTAPKTSNDVFRSQQEVVRAMGDPRYDNDPAYRQDIIEKLERSDVQF